MARVPRVVSAVGENFTKLVDGLIDAAEKDADVFHTGGQSHWHQPSDWEGNPLVDIETPMTEAFDRTEENRYFTEATKSPDDPGAVVDVIVSQIQVDAIAIRERAFRRRHLSRCRAIVLAGARCRFQADPAGTYRRGLEECVQNMLTQAQAGTGE